MQRFYKFIVVLFLLATNWLSGQSQTAHSRSIKSLTSLNGKLVKPSLLSPSQLGIPGKTADHLGGTGVSWTITNIPSDHSLKMLGIVCKAEYAVEKKLKLPLALRVRAGSLDYVNKMEGKK